MLVGIVAVLIVAAMAGVYGLTRGPHLTHYVRDEILPVFKQKTGLSVEIDQLVVNLFPLYIEARGCELRGVDNTTLARAETVRGHVSLTRILSKAIEVRYLVVDGLTIYGPPPGTIDLFDTVPEPLAEGIDNIGFPVGGGFTVTVQRALVDDLAFAVTFPKSGLRVRSVAGSARLIPGKRPKLSLKLGRVFFEKNGTTVVEARVRGAVSWAGRQAEFSSLRMESDGDWIEAAGGISSVQSAFDVSGKVSLALLQRIAGRPETAGYVRFDGLVSGTPAELIHDPEVDVRLEASARVEDVLDLFSLPPYVSGPAHAEGVYQGKLRSGVSTGTARINDGVIVGLTGVSLTSRYRWQGTALRFDEVDGEVLGGRVTRGTVDLDFDHPVSYRVSTDVIDVSSHRLLQYVGWVPPHREGRVNGVMQVRGSGGDWRNIQLSGTAAYESDGEGKDVVGRIRTAFGRFNLEKGVLSLSNLSLYGVGYSAWGEGSVDLDNEWLNFDVGLYGEDLGRLVPPRKLVLEGNVLFSGSITGPPGSPVVSGEMRVSDGRVDRIPFQTAAGRVGWSYGKLKLEDIRVSAGESRFRIEGELTFPEWSAQGMGAPRYSVHASSTGIPLAEISSWFEKESPLMGRAAGDVYVSGEGDKLAVGVEALVTEGTVFGHPFERAVVKMTTADNETRVEHLSISARDGMLTASGVYTTGGRVCFDLEARGIDLVQIPGVPEGLTGVIDGRLQCGTDGRMEGVIALRDLVLGEVPFGDGELLLDMSKGSIEGRGTLLGGRAKVEGTLSTGKMGGWTVRTTLRDDDYGDLLRGMKPSLPDNLGFSLEGNAVFRGGNVPLTGTFYLASVGVSREDINFQATHPVVISFENNRLTWDAVRFAQGETELNVKGTVVPGREINVEARGALDLALVAGVVDGLESARGTAHLTMAVEGDWTHPTVEGRLELSGGDLMVGETPIRISDLNGTVLIDREAIRVPALKGRIGDGTVSFTGIARIAGFAVTSVQGELTTKNVGVRVSPDLFVEMDGYLVLDHDTSRTVLSGDIDLKRAFYTGRVDWREWILKAKRSKRIRGGSGWYERAELNVHVSGEDSVIVQNNIARTSLDLDVYLRGNARSPRLMGRLEANGGSVYFRSKEFEILNGSAEFLDPSSLNPILSINAVTETQGYEVRLGLDGPIDRLTLSLFSDPPLSEVDILSLLTVGKVGQDLENIEGAVGASEAASFLAGSLQDTIEGRIKTVTGFDRFQVDPYVDTTTGAIGPRLTVGKRLLSDRVNVTYSTNVGTTEEQFLKVEYEMNRNVSLVGMRDELGSIGVDVRLRFEFE